MDVWGIGAVVAAGLLTLAGALLVRRAFGKVERRLDTLGDTSAQTLIQASDAHLAASAACAELQTLNGHASRLRRRGPQGSNPEITGPWQVIPPDEGGE